MSSNIPQSMFPLLPSPCVGSPPAVPSSSHTRSDNIRVSFNSPQRPNLLSETAEEYLQGPFPDQKYVLISDEPLGGGGSSCGTISKWKRADGTKSIASPTFDYRFSRRPRSRRNQADRPSRILPWNERSHFIAHSNSFPIRSCPMRLRAFKTSLPSILSWCVSFSSSLLSSSRLLRRSTPNPWSNSLTDIKAFVKLCLLNSVASTPQRL